MNKFTVISCFSHELDNFRHCFFHTRIRVGGYVWKQEKKFAFNANSIQPAKTGKSRLEISAKEFELNGLKK